MPQVKGAEQGIRHHHRRLVLDALRQTGPQSKGEIAQRTGLSANTVAGLVTELREASALTTAPARSPAASKTGRPPDLVSLNPTLAGLAGIEFGSGLIKVAVADLSQRVVTRGERSLAIADEPLTALDEATSMVHEALEAARMPKSKLLGVGVSLPAPVDRVQDRLRSTNFPGPGWANPGLNPARQLRERLQVPVETDNDANLAALAELVGGAGKGHSHFVYVKAAAGIGGGLVLDGKVYRGADGTAGELAHIVVDPHGEICYCGNWGCLWTVIGAEALARTLSLTRLSDDAPRGAGARYEYHEALVREVIDDARNGDLRCQRVLQDAGRQLGRAVANLCTILNLQLVVVGGTLSTAGELVLAPMQYSLNEYRSRLSSDVVPVVPSTFGENAELQGALALVLQSEADDVRKRLDSSLKY